MKVVVSARAARDLAEGHAYLAERSPVAAGTLVESFFSLARRLAAGEFEGPERRLRTGQTCRSWPLPPYRLFYRRTKGALVVLRLYHQARRPL